MSDPQNPSHEQPEAGDVDDVVGSANAGLAEAQAAADASTAQAPRVDEDAEAFAAAEAAFPGTFASPAVTTSAEAVGASAETERLSVESQAASDAFDTAPGALVEPPTPRVFDSSGQAAENAGAFTSAGSDLHQSMQPIFVQAPEAPRPRGNRGAVGLMGLLAAVAFAVLYLGAMVGLGVLLGDVKGTDLGEFVLAAATSWGLWIPTVVFYFGFWFLGAIINRGRWGHWVVFGIVVGLISYGGHLLGQLFEAPFWRITATQGVDLINEQLLAPLAIVAFVLGREITIWFGAWAARRGAQLTVLNAEAQREYERTLEAGPQLPQ